ncbi:aspartate/glutamate racemase family protein [Bacillus alkalicola]|uniref:Aspartate/glutamate racemase family protein n=2 Tax=Bacillales TaxID=1385 RepID=A0ABS6JU69_9BACI|nr:aspartate/glutamate racemase family protein [Bacillus alkalicola]
MRKIGLIGGMSYESTLVYYQKINEGVRDIKGGLHSAECILYSVDFGHVEVWMREGKWEKAGQYLAQVAQKLEAAGAEGILLCTNTMHKVADYIDAAINVPFLHIGEIIGNVIRRSGKKNVLLLGTKYTMEQSFLVERIKQYGINVTVPESGERETINRVIFQELCLGSVNEKSRKGLYEIINKYEGIDGVILGCTELALLIKKEDLSIQLFDSTSLHIQSAISFMLNNN